jgi:hypothetical protein
MWSFPLELLGVDGGGEPLMGVIACQVGSCSCSCCRQVTAVMLTAAAVAIIRVGSHSLRVVEGGVCTLVLEVVVVVDRGC